jgi:predicted DNA-binding protein
MNNTSIKYTAVLPNEYVTELKELASKKIIPSVNYGIRKAVEKYLEQAKKEIYAQNMAEAAKDEDFLKRTLDCQKDFINADCEVGGEW